MVLRFRKRHVQGVGFRYTSLKVAKGYEVVGWVKNRPDGRVELQIQGRPDELGRYLGAVESEIQGKIVEMEKEVQPVELSLKGFEIRR